nr:hypothetical protein [Streptomyces sp. alain-838]
MPVPCCAFWQHSDGAVHGPRCTRPTAARAVIGEGCCEPWWTSLGTRHDTDCRRHSGSPERNRARTSP